MKKFGPAHFLGIGVLAGVLAATHIWTLVLISFLIGLFARRIWDAGHHAAVKTGSLVQARIETERERRREVRSRARKNTEKSRQMRAERDRAEEKAYYRGAADAGAPPTWPGHPRV